MNVYKMDHHHLGSSNKNISHYAQTLTYLLGELKHVFDQRVDDPDSTKVSAFERLGEISKIMRLILEKYPLLKSKELLLDASNLVHAVKTYDYQNYSLERHSKLMDSINALYRSFQFNISNCLMQDIVTLNSAQSSNDPLTAFVSSGQSSSTSSSYTQVSTNSNINNLNNNNNNNNNNESVLSEGRISMINMKSRTLPISMPEERIFACENGLDELFKQAKAWSKYLKEIVTYGEKRVQIENDYSRSILKNAQNLRTTIHHLKCDKAFLPFNIVYDQFCQNEIKNANIRGDNFDLLIRNILNPVNEFRIELDKQLKKIKEDWSKENKQLNDALTNLTKSREIYVTKLQETEKAKPKLSEGSLDFNSEKLDRLEKTTEEADNQYNKYILNLQSQRELFKKAKRDIINRLQNLLTIIEIKIKEISSHYFETLRDSITYTPEEIQKTINDTNLYETGKSYRDFANSLPDAAQTSLMYSSQDTQEIDSSESDNNNSSSTTSTFLMKHRKEPPKSILINSSSKQSSSNNSEIFSSKSKEKNYKSCYGHYSVTTSSVPERTTFFGVPLSSLSTNSAPDIIKRCIQQIEIRGSHINGIYRVSAVKSQVDNLCNSYEKDPESIDLSSVAPNVIANFLKQFFRMLPEPLLTFQLYPDFIEIALKYPKNQSHGNEIEIIEKLKQLVHRLPPVHYYTLRLLMCHLNRISKDSAHNQMNPGNLGIVFGPTLIKKQNDDNALLYDTNHQSRIIELLIVHSDQIFDSTEPLEQSLHRKNSFGSMTGCGINLKNENISTQ
ncbi:Rho GTPase-activating protein 45 [Sarcoptes scabiei]|nr:Rho GTPase-activating protein 45 [Sarcoptes scabiei]